MGYKIVNIDKESQLDDWLAFRFNGIGGSEIGTMMGVNPWKSAVELYYQKIGDFDPKVDYNTPMFMGNVLEPVVADLFEYWDDGDNLITNYASGLKQRKLYEVQGYVLNDDYPGMFFSPDRIVHTKPLKRKDKLIQKNVEQIVEIKTISNWSAKQWESGLPPSYYLQLQTYLMGLDCDEGYIVSLKDGRDLDVIYIERNREVGEMIWDTFKNFWERVQYGRQAIQEKEDIHQFAPDADGTQSLEKFLSTKYKNPEENTIQATDEVVQWASEHLELVEQGKEIDREVRERANKIKSYMKDFTILDLGDNGRVTWRANSRGNRIFRNLYESKEEG